MEKLYIVGGLEEQSGVFGAWNTLPEAEAHAMSLMGECSVGVYTVELGKSYTSKQLFAGTIKCQEMYGEGGHD